MGGTNEVSNNPWGESIPHRWHDVSLSLFVVTLLTTVNSPISVRLMPLLKCKIHRLTVALEG